MEKIPEAFQNLREKINHLDWLENLFGSFVGSSTDSSTEKISSQALGFFATTFGVDVPLPLSLAVLAGILTFIPNIGPILAIIPAVDYWN